MAEEEKPLEGVQAQEPEPDYKAKYEQMRAHSREWEKKAKANAQAAEELEQLKASHLSDLEHMQRQYQKEKERADALAAEKERASWVTEVSKSTGVPRDVLDGMAASSADELMERAESIKGYFERPAAPVVPTDGVQPPEPSAGKTANDWLRSTIPNSIKRSL